MDNFKKARDKAAEDYLQNATVYYTDMEPLRLSRGHYFKRGADWAEQRSEAKLKIAIDALETIDHLSFLTDKTQDWAEAVGNCHRALKQLKEKP